VILENIMMMKNKNITVVKFSSVFKLQNDARITIYKTAVLSVLLYRAKSGQ